MTRGLGVAEWLAATLEPVEPLLAVLTQLGDVWFLLVLTVGLYWFADRVPLAGWTRSQGLLVLGTAMWAFAVTYALKEAIAIPRPPGAGTPSVVIEGSLRRVYDAAATGSGYGFPSGHATGTAAVYGVIALLARDEAGRRRRLAGAAGLVALISVTRLGLGVHYLVDVIVGAALGFAVALLAARLRRRPVVVLGLAALSAAPLTVLGPVAGQAVALTFGTLGLVASWLLVRPLDRPRRVGALWVVLAGVGAILAAAAVVRAGALVGSVALAALGAGLAAVALPAALHSDEK